MGGYNVLYSYSIIVCLTDIEMYTILFIDNIISSFVYQYHEYVIRLIILQPDNSWKYELKLQYNYRCYIVTFIILIYVLKLKKRKRI